jgi:hypothetical protein
MFNESDRDYFRRVLPPPVPERNPNRVAPPLPPGINIMPVPEGVTPPTPEDFQNYMKENPPAPPYKEPELGPPEEWEEQEASYDGKGGLLSGIDKEPSMEEWRAVYEILSDEARSEEERAAAVKLLRELRERSRHWDSKKEGRSQQRA